MTASTLPRPACVQASALLLARCADVTEGVLEEVFVRLPALVIRDGRREIAGRARAARGGTAS